MSYIEQRYRWTLLLPFVREIHSVCLHLFWNVSFWKKSFVIPKWSSNADSIQPSSPATFINKCHKCYFKHILLMILWQHNIIRRFFLITQVIIRLILPFFISGNLYRPKVACLSPETEVGVGGLRIHIDSFTGIYFLYLFFQTNARWIYYIKMQKRLEPQSQNLWKLYSLSLSINNMVLWWKLIFLVMRRHLSNKMYTCHQHSLSVQQTHNGQRKSIREVSNVINLQHICLCRPLISLI